jgi:hypothetical protein
MAQDQYSQSGARPLYAVTIQQTMAGGDLQQMKDVLKEAEEHVRKHADIPAAIEKLKAEIAKREQKK